MKKWMVSFLTLFLKISLAIVVVYFLLKDIDFEYLREIVIYIDKKYVLVAIVIVAFTFIILSVKWGLLLPELSFSDRLRKIAIGHTLSYLLGGQLVGDASKVLTDECGIKRTSVAATVIVDKLLGLVGTFLVGIFGAVVSISILKEEYVFLIIGASIVGILLVCLIFNRKIYSCISQYIKGKEFWRLKGLNTLTRTIMGLIDGLYYCTLSKTKIVLSVLYGIMLQLMSALMTYCIFMSFGTQVHFGFLCAISEVGAIVGLIPFSLAGIGITQITEKEFLELYGVVNEQISAQIAIKYFIMVAYAMLGCIVILGNRKIVIPNIEEKNEKT